MDFPPSCNSIVNIAVTAIFTCELNTAVQLRVTSDPKGGMGLVMLLDNIRETGAGTANKEQKCVYKLTV